MAHILETNGVIHFPDPYTEGFGWEDNGEDQGVIRLLIVSKSRCNQVSPLPLLICYAMYVIMYDRDMEM